MAKKVTNGIVHNPDNDKDTIHITTGELFRPPIWAFRRAVQKLAELQPESPAVDLWILIKERPYSEDIQTDWISYREEVIPYIWYIYAAFQDVRKTNVETVCLWIIRCSHYYWFAGPKPSRKYQPRKKSDKMLTETWREKLVCPTCNEMFTYDGIHTDIREDVMYHYNRWLQGHTKVCANLTWDKVSLATKRKIAKEVLEERKAKEEQQIRDYQEWLSRHQRPSGTFTPSQLEWNTYLTVMRKAMKLIQDLVTGKVDKDGNLLVKKNIPQAIFRMKMLTKYIQLHAITPELKSVFYDLCDQLGIRYPKL